MKMGAQIYPKRIPDFLVRTVKRSKRQSIWMPGPTFPDEPFDMYDHQMKPDMLGNQLLWLHMPSQKPITWRIKWRGVAGEGGSKSVH
jgi:hypothetical protein